MDSRHETFSTPRSGAGFVLAITLALFTFWGAGLVFQLHSYAIDPPIQRAAAATAPSGGCAGDAYVEAPCAPAIQPHEASSTR